MLPSMMLPVNEIFDSIDGEGKRTGQLAAFIRLMGCNLNCSYCDTRYAFTDGQMMETSEIAWRVRGTRNVTLTGGEPLIHDIKPLLTALHGHEVNIETNGSRQITDFFEFPHVFFTVDYKCKSSLMSAKMWPANFRLLRPQDVLKFVVGNLDDLVEAKEVCEQYKPICPVYISPVFGKIEPETIVRFMQAENMEGWRLQLQLHKIIWEPTRRGV